MIRLGSCRCCGSKVLPPFYSTTAYWVWYGFVPLMESAEAVAAQLVPVSPTSITYGIGVGYPTVNFMECQSGPYSLTPQIRYLKQTKRVYVEVRDYDNNLIGMTEDTYTVIIDQFTGVETYSSTHNETGIVNGDPTWWLGHGGTETIEWTRTATYHLDRVIHDYGMLGKWTFETECTLEDHYTWLDFTTLFTLLIDESSVDSILAEIGTIPTYDTWDFARYPTEGIDFIHPIPGREWSPGIGTRVYPIRVTYKNHGATVLQSYAARCYSYSDYGVVVEIPGLSIASYIVDLGNDTINWNDMTNGSTLFPAAELLYKFDGTVINQIAFPIRTHNTNVYALHRRTVIPIASGFEMDSEVLIPISGLTPATAYAQISEKSLTICNPSAQSCSALVTPGNGWVSLEPDEQEIIWLRLGTC